MKRRTEHLVEKRDGRREFLRATKLARSVHLALYEIGVDEDWRALELAGVVLEGLRQKQASKSKEGSVGGAVVLTTAEIADAVQHLLVVTGQPTAAVAYGAVQAERARRRQLVGVGKAVGLGGSLGSKVDPARVAETGLDPIPKAGPRSGASKAPNASPNGAPDAKKPAVQPANRIWGEG